MWELIAAQIAEVTGEPFTIERNEPMGGGCINQASRIQADDGRSYFVKLNSEDGLAMFEAERDGLNEMRSADAIRVPEPVCAGSGSGSAWLVMEYVPLGGRGDATQMGEQLAALHGHVAERFGWWRDNTIGATPQVNTRTSDWVTFWREHRLGFQLRLAERHGLGQHTLARGERLLDGLDAFFADYQPEASLLHGDLWGGNAGYDRDGAPVIYDPAVYYGDREADIAMTELFGGFGARFLAGYQSVWPLDPGYRVRKTLYNLYHILNHFNLFGGGYGSQAGRMIDQLLAEL